VAVVTEWNEFRGLNLRRLKRMMRSSVVCDLRNIYDPAAVEAAGLGYVGVGRGRAATATGRTRAKRTRRAPRKAK